MGTATDTRVIRVSQKAEAGIIVKNKETSIVGDKRHFINVDGTGVTIRGPISIVATSESTRRAGLFVGLNDFSEALPSCIVIPLPKNIQLPPYFMLANMAADIGFFMSFLI